MKGQWRERADNKCIGTLAWESWGYWRLDACTIVTVSESCHYSWWIRWLHRVIFRLARLFVTGLWSLLYVVALGCCRGLCGAMVMTRCHLICSVNSSALSSTRLPISLACAANISKFQKDWIHHLEPRAGKYSVISLMQQPQGEGGAVSCQTGQGDRAFSQQGRGRRSWATERVFQSIR